MGWGGGRAIVVSVSVGTAQSRRLNVRPSVEAGGVGPVFFLTDSSYCDSGKLCCLPLVVFSLMGE